MDQTQQSQLITNRLTAAVGVILTGYVTVLTLRFAFWESPHDFHWLLPLVPRPHLLSRRGRVGLNLTFYAWLLWACKGLLRTAQGRERPLLAGWVSWILLSLIQVIVPISFAAAIQYVKAISIMVAFAAAVVILVEGPKTDTGVPNVVDPQQLLKGGHGGSLN